MLKILIVDDEPFIREGLKTLINWEEYDAYICGEAVNGRDGLIKVEELCPDIVIADIKMPGIDGIQMIKEIRRTNQRIHFIVLSGYSEFKYAQQAIELKVDCYIMKPIQKEELIEKVIKIKESMGAERNAASKDKREVKDILRGLINGSIKKEEVPDCLKGNTELLQAGAYQAALCTFTRKARIDTAFFQKAEHFLSGRAKCITLPEDGNLIILFFGKTYTSENRIFMLLTNYLEEVLGKKIVIALGSREASLSDIGHSIEIAKEFMKYKFLYEEEEIVIDSEMLKKYEPSPKLLSHDPGNELQKELFIAFSMNSREQIRLLVKKLCKNIRFCRYEEDTAKNNMANMCMTLINQYLLNHSGMKEIISINQDFIIQLYRKENLHLLQDSVITILSSIAENIEQYNPHSVIDKIMDYTNRNYNSEIKLDMFAKNFHYSSSYLGKQFKNTAGISFNTFINKVRIGKAKEFLQKGYKIYEVAQMVGYSDKDYFTEMFKKYVGVTPSEYKSSDSEEYVKEKDIC